MVKPGYKDKCRFGQTGVLYLLGYLPNLKQV